MYVNNVRVVVTQTDGGHDTREFFNTKNNINDNDIVVRVRLSLLLGLSKRDGGLYLRGPELGIASGRRVSQRTRRVYVLFMCCKHAVGNGGREQLTGTNDKSPA